MTEQKTIYFRNMDFLRFIAAFMIVVLHGYEAWCGWFGELGVLTNGTYHEFSWLGAKANQLLENLGFGVEIFFLMSGFLITYILLEEKKRNEKIHIWNFIIRRTLRIWPLYYLLVIASPFLVNMLGSEPAPNYLAQVFFLGNFEIISSKSWTYPFSHFWSICVEEHFYLAWPFVIQFVRKKWLLPTFFLLIFGSIFFRLYAYAWVPDAWYTLFAHTFSRIDAIVIGAIGAYYYSERPFQVVLPSMVKWVLVLLLITITCMEPMVLWDSPVMAGFKKYIYILLVVPLLLNLNFNPQALIRMPFKKVFSYLGKVSYGIYMYSNILLLVVIKGVISIGMVNPWLFFFLIIASSIVVPIISYELFEKPFLKLGKRFRMVETKR